MTAGFPLNSDSREEWRRSVAQPPAPEGQTEPGSQLVFRAGSEWFSIAADCVLEVTGSLPVHAMPHRAGSVVGVINIRGKVIPCVSLHALLSPLPGEPATLRTIVFQQDNWWCAARVDDVDGVHLILSSAIRPLPAPHDRAASDLIELLWIRNDRTIAQLASDSLFATFRRILA